MNLEIILMFLSQTKFITPIIILIFGGFIRSLQLPYSTSMKSVILRIILMLFLGVTVSLLVETENDLFMILTSFLIGYFSIDVSNMICTKCKK